MKIEATALPDVKLVTPVRHGDTRGFFAETFKSSAFAEAGLPSHFVQDNHSLSATVGTIRGLHYQSMPYPQDKLVRVLRGRVLDVAVDIRKKSPTFGRHVAVELSADNFLQLFVPIGFAHGFCTLEPDTEIIYKVTAPYAPQCDFGLAFDDPALGIAWPVDLATATLSDKDRKQPRLADLPSHFE